MQVQSWQEKKDCSPPRVPVKFCNYYFAELGQKPISEPLTVARSMGCQQSWAGVIRGGLVSLESQGLRVGVDYVLLQKKTQTKMSIKKAVDGGEKI